MQQGFNVGPIKASEHPASVLGHSGHKHKKKVPIPDLNLASMVDIFSVLVVFLISLFSTDGEIVTPNKDISLPMAKISDPMDQANVIKVGTFGVMFDNKVVASLENIKNKTAFDSSDNFMLAELNENLKKSQKAYELIRQDGTKDTHIIFQVDKQVPYFMLKAAMYTATVNGYETFKFAVLPK